MASSHSVARIAPSTTELSTRCELQFLRSNLLFTDNHDPGPLLPPRLQATISVSTRQSSTATRRSCLRTRVSLTPEPLSFCSLPVCTHADTGFSPLTAAANRCLQRIRERYRRSLGFYHWSAQHHFSAVREARQSLLRARWSQCSESQAFDYTESFL